MIRKPEVLAKKLGLHFDQIQLFIMALTHRSASSRNNERLEYLGDSILGFVIADYLFQMFPDASEGDLSRLRASLVNQSSLAEIARENKIGDFLILGSGELKSGGYGRDSILSDAVEAIMGALLIDQGIKVCQDWILNLFAKKIADLSLLNCEKDPKTQLQEMMQSRKLDLPRYELIKTKGVEHKQLFSVNCTTTLLSEACLGTGVSRKKAEQSAAEKMLVLIDKQKK